MMSRPSDKTDATVPGSTVTVKVRLRPPYEAVTVTVVAVLTVPATTKNFAELSCLATLTEEGTFRTAGLELARETIAAVCAAALRVTFPTPEFPLASCAGLTETLLILSPAAAGGGLTVTLNVLLTPKYEAVKVADVVALTVPAVTVNVPEVWPCGTVTAAGTLAAVVLELDSDTTTPPLPAAAVRLTVPVVDPPLAIVLELAERLLSAG